jgi:hypothetical protein
VITLGMGYFIDLHQVTIADYQQKLSSGYLPPGRLVLKEKPDERFGYFKSMGITNVGDLIRLLKKKDQFAKLSKLDIFSGDYLKILLRELNSILPKPNKLSDFVQISKETKASLQNAGITDTEKLFNKVLKKADRQVLSESTGIKNNEIECLARLSDLSRIKWVGVTYAQMLYDLGVDTVKKVSLSDPVDLHTRINNLIKEKNIFKGTIGLNDVRILVEAARELPLDIEFEKDV